MGWTKKPNIFTLAALEAEKCTKQKKQQHCGTPCSLVSVVRDIISLTGWKQSQLLVCNLDIIFVLIWTWVWQNWYSGPGPRANASALGPGPRDVSFVWRSLSIFPFEYCTSHLEVELMSATYTDTTFIHLHLLLYIFIYVTLRTFFLTNKVFSSSKTTPW